jgi:hypothetical protein
VDERLLALESRADAWKSGTRSRFRVKAKADPPPSVTGVAVSFSSESRSCAVRPRVISPERSSAFWCFEPAGTLIGNG